jgi:hypothetical protein
MRDLDRAGVSPRTADRFEIGQRAYVIASGMCNDDLLEID